MTASSLFFIEDMIDYLNNLSIGLYRSSKVLQNVYPSLNLPSWFGYPYMKVNSQWKNSSFAGSYFQTELDNFQQGEIFYPELYETRKSYF